MTAYAGVRVVDFSQGVGGPMAAMLLADFGAEVVKVEPPGGDRMRDHPGYLAFNRNKQVLTLDLGRDLEAVRTLIAGADVAIFDHAPGALQPLGLDAATLTAQHPHLVHAWTPPYGTSGRWSGLPPRHSLLAALSGVAFRQGCYGDQPVHLVLPVLWYGQAVTAAGAIGAALFERTRSGRGQAVTVSGLHGLSEVSGPVRVLAAPPLPRGLPLGATPSYRLYRCGDGRWFFLGTLFANFYRKAVEATGLMDHWESMLIDPIAARELLSAAFATRPRTEWLQVLQDHGVPCAPVGDRRDWFASEPVVEAGLRCELDHPTLGRVAVPGVAARLEKTPGAVRHLARPIATPPAWPARKAAPAGPSAAQPLAGVRVLDLGTVIAGAYAGCLLANLGADVIKVEPVEGDPFRSDNGGFLAYNRGKRGLGLDLKQPAARELFYDLARQADVVIDNYRLGVRARLGIDYETLKGLNPRLISGSINAYGDVGARAALPGFDPLLQAEGGMQAAQGGDDEPILHTIPVNDVATSAMVAFAVVAALNARARTGEGQEIKTSLMAQSLTFQFAEVVDYEGRPSADRGGRDCLGLTALTRFYACADGWLAIACETDEEARGLATALGFEVDPAEALAAPRDGDLAHALDSAFAVRTRDEALAALLAAGVPAAPALRAAEALADPYLAENHVLELWDHPRLGAVLGVRAFADFSRTPSGFRTPTPDLGEHSAELLAELGIAPARIEALFAAGAVFEPAGTAHALAKSARPGNDSAALAVQ